VLLVFQAAKEIDFHASAPRPTCQNHVADGMMAIDWKN